MDQKLIQVKHVSSLDRVVDVLTKALSSSRFLLLRNKLRVEQMSTLSLRGEVKRTFCYLLIHMSLYYLCC